MGAARFVAPLEATGVIPFLDILLDTRFIKDVLVLGARLVFV